MSTTTTAREIETGTLVDVTRGERRGTLTEPHTSSLLSSRNNHEMYEAVTSDGRRGTLYVDFAGRTPKFIAD